MYFDDKIENQTEDRHAADNNLLFYDKFTEAAKRDFCACLAHAFHYGQASRECDITNHIHRLLSQINAKSRGYETTIDIPEDLFHGLSILQQQITMDGQIKRKKHRAETYKNSADEFYALYFDDNEATCDEVASH